MLKVNAREKAMKKYALLAISILAFSPCALAAGGSTGWLDTLIQYAKNIQIGLYTLAGVIVLCCVIVSGIRLAVSRMSGNHDKTFWDYIGDLRVPQFVLLGIIFLGIIITGISCSVFSWYGLIALIIPATLFIVVRIMCESDSRFLTRLRFMLGRYLRNMVYGRALLITPCNPRWNQFYGRRIAQKRFISRDQSAVDELPCA
ncbi:hypothetical protein HZS38_04775 [Xenorhabdus nematophila]|uniref:hypothetical protein n=1 Tax=Xenorhabdus nematophila TaxID=628 RepID=UPI00054322E9|nr:hypothetical protein [Xenorhabdus nematophila]MBA0018512.1 hypothetical protein [Xenorhabdus nematophila]CEF32331.1 membrane hypothetical protein [Xenorhabdus nematophila str. Websteri]